MRIACADDPRTTGFSRITNGMLVSIGY